MSGWYPSEVIEEKYLPEKQYPTKGVISGEVIANDLQAINLWLRSPEGIFGSYKVVEYLGRIKNKPWSNPTSVNGVTWKIQCKCGYERLISHRQLRSFRNHIVKRGSQSHCNNPIHDEEFKVGKKYDRLTVIGYRFGYEYLSGGIIENKNLNINTTYAKRDQNRSQWLVAFSCSCGKHTSDNPYIVLPISITTNYNKGRRIFGCGCYSKTQDGKSNTIEYIRWSQAKARAKKDNLPFNIDVDDCIAPDKCPILGMKLISTPKEMGPQDNSPSLDKIIPQKGYVKGNVAIISQLANRVKNSAKTSEEIRQVADWYEKELRKRGWAN